MDWNALLDQRLAASSQVLIPYRLAVAIEGPSLPKGRQLYAIADVLDVEPGAIMVDLRDRLADEQAVTAYLDALEARIVRACVVTPL